MLRAYGADVVVCPTAVPPDHPDSYYSVSNRLVEEIDGAWKPDQYSNPMGPASHYETTGPEIWADTDGKVTHFVAGVGTGGTITGAGRYLKEVSGGQVQVVGADPEGSVYSGGTGRPYLVEGVGEDFWPSAYDPVPPPALWLMAAFYLLVLTAMLPRLRPGLRWCLRAGRAAPCLVMLVLPLQRGLARLAPEGETRVTLLAVGAGQCAVVQPPSGRTVLVDAGSSSLTDLVGKCLGPFLRHTRCTEVDTIVMSHGDYDHISAVEELVRGYGVREVWTSPQLVRHAAPGSQVQELLAALDRMERTPAPARPRRPHAARPRHDRRGPLAPAGRGLSQTTNDACLVIKLTHAGRSILFPGDIQDLAMRELLRDPAKLKSDVLVAAHHGSSESLTPAFVRAVDPQYIVSSNDRTPTNKQREFERMIGNRPLYRTNRCGAITIVISREGDLRVEPFLPQHRSE